MQADSPAIQQFRSWIRSQHLVCQGQDFIFETIDHSQLERFEACLNMLDGHVRSVRAIGNWPMGPRRTFKILRAEAAATGVVEKSKILSSDKVEEIGR